jgi:tetratricopeptide (TPR) repeat protein
VKGPLPYPYRATFLATTLAAPVQDAALVPYLARLVSVIVFDHLIRHPVVTLGDHDDERLTDDAGGLLDVHHAQAEDSFDWFFRVSRRREVLWFELGIDPAQPPAPVLRARRPDRTVDAWHTGPGHALSDQLDHCLTQWLAARHLPAAGRLPSFTLADLRSLAERLVTADDLLVQGKELGIVPRSLTQPPQRLPVPYLRVLAELSRDDARTLDPIILKLDPTHPVARRNRYVTGLLRGDVDRRAILPLIDEAPMYAKPHLSIWGEQFAADRPREDMGVRHQGIAASLMPANPYACHNYSLQLAEQERREESYRWADRATVTAPQFGAAHLDCVRRLRQVGRPGQAFAEAQYRCREILDRAAAGKLSASDWQAPHHARLLVAFVHLDVGRRAEAIELGDAALASVPDEPAARDAFAWADRRIAHWKADPGLFARAYAWEGHHRGDVGRVLTGLGRVRLSDDDDAMMWIDALCTIGRYDEAVIAYAQCAGQDGAGVLGDGKARLAAAKALIATGQLDEALDQIQIVQLRRSQSRLEAEINRLLRLAATRPARDWEQVVERRLARGATTLARMAARDLADFVPDLDPAVIRRALGEPKRLVIDPLWVAELIAAVPAAQVSAAAIVARLAIPAEATLAAADALASDWWTALVPPARDRDAHAAGTMLALGLAIANYLVIAARPASPIAGAYRHIATEALQLVRRSRYQIDPAAIQAVLRMVEWLSGAPEWLLDTWLLRIERALDLEAEYGAYLEGMIAELPAVARLLRGDERIGWELRLAHDLAEDPSQHEAAATLFARAARAAEAGGALCAWSSAAARALPAELDVHWLAALASPSHPEPWLALASGLLAAGRHEDGFDAACRGMTAVTPPRRAAALAALAPAWNRAQLVVPLAGDAAFERGVAAAAEGRLAVAVAHLRWAAAIEPGTPGRAHSLAIALARAGQPHEAIRVLSRHERGDAPRLIGRALVECGRDAEAVPILRFAARRFRAADDWAVLAGAAHRAGNDPVAALAGQRAISLGARHPAVLAVVATSLYRIGEFVECERVAHELIAVGERTARLAGMHAMARALAGQGRHVDAHPYARAAAELAPDGELAAELADTLDRIIGQEAPRVRPSLELSMERQACDDLEAGRFDSLITAVSSPSWGIARIALAACEVRGDDDNGLPVSPRALDAATAILERSAGATEPEAVLARIRALRVRDNAFIQIDPPPPLGTRCTAEEFERGLAEREHRPSTTGGAAR